MVTSGRAVSRPAPAARRPGHRTAGDRPLFFLGRGTTWDVTPGRDRLLVELLPGGGRLGTAIETVTNWFEELRRLAPTKK
jgi:hypothetical protein